MDGSSMDPAPGSACWFAVGPLTTVALQSGRLVEYDIATRSVSPFLLTFDADSDS